jgi:hypothetical protein
MQEETNKTKQLTVLSINFPLVIYTSSKLRLLNFWEINQEMHKQRFQ